ncbi:hypothetical protein Patl1_33524 [Pistacia atlantica]|uniref:Uncharacterized protein n=1 Tax=Pistacia atlantica TaxID=434234 RepID=A0ACC0ZT78_9ROSI|nr:hypothetical protein Patl1_33524 [Pistacia atlantica]
MKLTYRHHGLTLYILVNRVAINSLLGKLRRLRFLRRKTSHLVIKFEIFSRVGRLGAGETLFPKKLRRSNVGKLFWLNYGLVCYSWLLYEVANRCPAFNGLTMIHDQMLMMSRAMDRMMEKLFNTIRGLGRIMMAYIGKSFF